LDLCEVFQERILNGFSWSKESRHNQLRHYVYLLQHFKTTSNCANKQIFRTAVPS